MMVEANTARAFPGCALATDPVDLMVVQPSSGATADRLTRDVLDALNARVAVLDARGAVVLANSLWTLSLGDRSACSYAPVPEGEDWLSGLRVSGQPELLDLAGRVEDVLAGRASSARWESSRVDAVTPAASFLEISALRGQAPGAVVIHADGSWQRGLEDELAHRATHDELTGLPNRAALREALRASLDTLDDRQMLAVLFCDLDGFKDINDSLGHSVGDQVLVVVAGRLRRRCRQADIVARFGGDEFVVVQPVPDVAQARATADRLIEALTEPIRIGEADIAAGVSIGVVVVEGTPEEEDPVGVLLRDADTAMYHAKERGRRRHEVFDAQLRHDVSARLHYASQLGQAVRNQELHLSYQARRRCGDRGLVGVEALIRWSPDGIQDVPPSTFIPIAEQTGRIVRLGGWALRQAVAEVMALGDPRLSIAVNVSPRQLSSPDLVGEVAAALSEVGMPARRLVLEITESALMDDPDAARTVLSQLRDQGVTIALDDFGTGWSSLSYLRTLPVDVLKLDRSFVADLPHDPHACAVAAAVLGLGHGMGLLVVAEGVEDHRQLEILREMGCDEYQGFIDGVPGALADIPTGGF